MPQQFYCLVLTYHTTNHGPIMSGYGRFGVSIEQGVAIEHGMSGGGLWTADKEGQPTD